MMISTRGRYALRVIIDLAGQNGSEYIPMKDIAARQGISKKYMEQIMPVLVKNGLAEGLHGPNGGYKLTRKPDEYRIGEILRLTEGDLAPVACLCRGAEPCERSAECKTVDMWNRFYRLTNEFFDGITVGDLLK